MEKQKEVVINERIPTKEKVCYGIGGFMDGGGVALMSCIMLKYMTSMGVAMAVASTIMTVAKLWDAVTDPLMGFISDNTRSKWGRRKPYMFVGGILLIVTLFIMFMPIRDWGVSEDGFTAFILIPMEWEGISMQVIREAGKEIPRDVSLVTYENSSVSPFQMPPLTTLEFDYPELVRNALDQLLLEIDGLDGKSQIIVPTKLNIRQSTGPCPA